MKPIKAARPAGYYDAIFAAVAAGRKPDSLGHILERARIAAGYTVGDLVLDLGCGLALVADMIGEREYLGLDFSETAIAESRRLVKNPSARFEVADLRQHQDLGKFDTVLVMEILEHVDDPQQIASLAIKAARKRIIVTVPRDMPGRSHVWPKWEKADMLALFGDLACWELFGGEHGDFWWLAVKDIEQ